MGSQACRQASKAGLVGTPGSIMRERCKDADGAWARMRTQVRAVVLRPAAPEAWFLAKQAGMVDNTDKRNR